MHVFILQTVNDSFEFYHPQQIEEDSKEEKPGAGDGSEAQQN